MQLQLRKVPHLQQQAFINCDIWEQLYGGAKRGGKSVAIAQKSTLLSVLFPGNRILISRLNFTDLYDTTINEFFQVCPPELILDHNKGERRITLATVCPHVNSTILYRGLGDPDDFEKVKSLTIGALALDEPTEVPLETYLMLLAQLTWQLPGCTKCGIPPGRPPYMAMLASNPEAGWVEDRFIELIEKSYKEALSVVVEGKRAYIPAKPSDNPFLPGDYVQNLIENFPADWVEKYVRGKWTSGEGAIFKEFMDEIHDLDNWLPPAQSEQQGAWWEFCWGLELYGALDHASTGWTAYLLMGTDCWGNKFVLAEHYEKNMLVSQHADAIKGMRTRYLTRVAGGAVQKKGMKYELIDPSCTQKTQQGGGSGNEGQVTVGKGGLQSINDLYRDQGLYFIPGWNALEKGLETMKEFFHPLPSHQHPFTGAMGAPALFISRTRCPQTWKDVRGLKKKLTPAGATQILGRDHGCDCVRYWINSQPRRAEMAALDAQRMGNAEAAALRAHQRWEAQFHQAATGEGDNWFSGMGMTVHPHR